jgi:tRNA 2-thiouridine synthesizing protein A
MRNRCYNSTQIPVSNECDLMDIDADVMVDASGLRCPEPLMVVRNKMMDMESGQIIQVLATDPSTSWDFPKFCTFLRHELVHKEEHDEGQGTQYLYWIRKG